MVKAGVTKLKEVKTQKLLEKHRIRPCYVKLFRLNVLGNSFCLSAIKHTFTDFY